MSTRDYGLRHKALGLCRVCTKPVVEGSATYCDFHREKDRANGRRVSKNAVIQLKADCLKHYGEKCNCCGEKLIQFLTIDHTKGDGNKQRRELFGHNVGGLHTYRWLKKNNYPDGLQVLCMNCNWATRYGGNCPHNLER